LSSSAFISFTEDNDTEVKVRNVKISGKRAANCTVCPVGPRDIVSGQTQQKTPLPAIVLLLHDVDIGAEPHRKHRSQLYSHSLRWVA
jgi:hypothetical protein